MTTTPKASERITPTQRSVLAFIDQHPAYFETGHRTTGLRTFASGYVVQTNTVTEYMLKARGFVQPLPGDDVTKRHRWTLTDKGRALVRGR